MFITRRAKLLSLASCYPLRSFTSPAVIGFFGWQRETDLWCKLMYTINQRTTHTRNKQLALRIHRSSTAENCCCYHEYKWTNVSCCQGVFVHGSLFFSSASSLQRMWQFADFLWSLFVVLWTFASFCHFHKSFLLTTVCLEAPPACCVSLC